MSDEMANFDSDVMIKVGDLYSSLNMFRLVISGRLLRLNMQFGWGDKECMQNFGGMIP
jgi:hypothetical protein